MGVDGASASGLAYRWGSNYTSFYRVYTGINFPLAHSEFAVNPHRRRRGVVPDHPVSSSVEELVAGRDAALELAVGLVIR